MLPFDEEPGVEIEHLLTHNGREYCGRPVGHPFELYLAIQQIQHRRTDIGSPETNGFCERFHHTVREEFHAVAFRRTLYESLEQLQGGSRCLRHLLQPRARPSRLSHPGPHAVSNLIRGNSTNAPREADTRGCLVYNLRHRHPGVRLISN